MNLGRSRRMIMMTATLSEEWSVSGMLGSQTANAASSVKLAFGYGLGCLSETHAL